MEINKRRNNLFKSENHDEIFEIEEELKINKYKRYNEFKKCFSVKKFYVGFSTKLLRNKHSHEVDFVYYDYNNVSIIKRIPHKFNLLYVRICDNPITSLEIIPSKIKILRRSGAIMEIFFSGPFKVVDGNFNTRKNIYLDNNDQILRYWLLKPIFRFEFELDSDADKFQGNLKHSRKVEISSKIFKNCVSYNKSKSFLKGNFQDEAIKLIKGFNQNFSYLIFCILSSFKLKYPIDLHIDFLVNLEKCIRNKEKSEDIIMKTLENLCYYRVIENITDEFSELILKRKFYKDYNKYDSINHRQIKKIFITPNMIYYEIPGYEQLNSALRANIDKIDNFVRLTFTDDFFEKSIYCFDFNKSIVTDVIERIMLDGIEMGKFKYSFLCYSNSQLKSHSVWFLNESEDFNYDTIFNNLGNFSKENIISKNAARRGLCFTTSKFLTEVENIKYIDDCLVTSDENDYCKDAVKNILIKEYNFTDGIGKVSLDLAYKAAKCFKKEYASAIQMRILGAKGILAIDKSLSKNTVCLRKSMIKFEGFNKSLNIIRVSSFSQGYLNKQIINLLSAWGIKDEVFINMQTELLKKFQGIYDLKFNLQEIEALKTTDFVKDLFAKNIINLKNEKKESLKKNVFFLKISHYIYNAFLNELRSKTKIIVEKSGIFIGIIDEFNLLKEGQVFLKVNKDKLHSLNSDNCFIVEGNVVITRNPCLYPGDIQILEAMNINDERFHYYQNVLVFSKHGARPIPQIIGGGDLDGDLYFVCWEKKLIPDNYKRIVSIDYYEKKNNINQNLKKPQLKVQDKSMKVQIISFFCDFLKNDILGTLCNRHLAWCDKEKEGAFSEPCKRLCTFQSKAVDFAKSGENVSYDELKKYFIKKWPDYMEKENSYESKKVLGFLYRQIRDVSNEIYDKKKLKIYDLNYNPDAIVMGFEIFLNYAKDMYDEYCYDLSANIKKYQMKSEFEFLTAMYMYQQKTILGKDNYDISQNIKQDVDGLLKKYKQKFGRLIIKLIDLILGIAVRRYLDISKDWYIIVENFTSEDQKFIDFELEMDLNQKIIIQYTKQIKRVLLSSCYFCSYYKFFDEKYLSKVKNLKMFESALVNFQEIQKNSKNILDYFKNKKIDKFNINDEEINDDYKFEEKKEIKSKNIHLFYSFPWILDEDELFSLGFK